jgi:hypothetical protein
METEINWLVSKRVLFARFSGEATPGEVIIQNRQLIQLTRDEGEAPVHLIVDASGLTKMPLTVKRLGETSAIMREPMLGWLILVTNNQLYNFVGTMVAQFSGIQMKTVNALDEALHKLEQLDASLEGKFAQH